MSTLLNSVSLPDPVKYLLTCCNSFVPLGVSGLDCFEGKSALFLGDSHHGYRPIRSVIEKAKQEPFDYYVSLYDRHHLHFFAEIFGADKTFWLPNFNLFSSFSLNSGARGNFAGFAGRISEYHPYRNMMIQCLMQSDLPFLFGSKAIPHSAMHGQCNVAINLSLNADFNLRNFGIIGHESFMLSDLPSNQSGLELFFEREEHFDVFETSQEMIAQSHRYLENPVETRAKALAASDIYWKELNPEIIRKSMLSIFEGESVDERFRSYSDPRIQFARSEDPNEFLFRVIVYECIQERHRNARSVAVTIFSDVPVAVLADLSDLPRLRLTRVTSACEKSKCDAQILQLCSIETVTDVPLGSEFDPIDVAVMMVSDVELYRENGGTLDLFPEILVIMNKDATSELATWIDQQEYVLTGQDERVLYIRKGTSPSKLKL